MMGRVSTVGVTVMAAMLGWVGAATAGEAHTAPAVHIISPSSASGMAMELDDLPPPQLELAKHPPRVDVPAIPAFTRAATATGVPGSPDGAPAPELEPASRLRRAIDDATLDASIQHLNACNRAIAGRQYEAAIAACRAATEVWPDNHLAWYAWASAHLARQEWPEARVAAARAVQLRPDRAMYQLYHGIALYEVERQRVRDAQARRDHKTPDEIALDPSLLALDAARDALALAIRRAPGLWRAHYYLGRIYRDLDDAPRAAQELTAAIQAHPGHRLSYIALSELYRRRDRLDQALAIATLGTRQVPAAEAAELWFEAGMVYDARRADGQALDAFGKALAIHPDDALAKLQRGVLYLRSGELAGARRDLEDVMRSADPRAASARPVAAKLLEQLASHAGAASHDARWDCGRSGGGGAIVCQPRAR